MRSEWSISFSPMVGMTDAHVRAGVGAWTVLSLMFFGIVPAAHIDSQTIRLARSPRTWLVWMQSCDIREDGLDNGPGCFHRVFPDEQHGIPMHGVSQKTLIGINLVRGMFL